MAAKLFAWAGGGLFVISLVTCAWTYFVRFGRPDQVARIGAGGLTPLAIDAILVTLFASHHSLFARERVKRSLSGIPQPLVKSVYVWIASVLLIVVCVAWQPIGGELYAVTGVRSIGLALVQFAGFALSAASVRGLDPLELAGIRDATGRSVRSGNDALQMTGAYRLVRHPLYLGWVLLFFGAAHMTGDRLAFAVLTSAYLFIAVPWEERSLRQSFGDDYERYKRLVRWRIIPFLY